MTAKELRHLIREAGRVPVERDTLYNEVIREKKTTAQWKTGRRLALATV
jgi:aminodeoxyfutalosine synthase